MLLLHPRVMVMTACSGIIHPLTAETFPRPARAADQLLEETHVQGNRPGSGNRRYH
jgi:hypothetical protein